MCSECVQSVFRVCLECAQGAFRVCSECVQSAFSVCSECVQSVFNIDVISSPSASSVSIFGIFFLNSRSEFFLSIIYLSKSDKMDVDINITYI